MNPFKVMFSIMGLIYVGITTHGFIGSNLGALIGTIGFLWCVLGWWYADTYLE